jgi:hypothetical protein
MNDIQKLLDATMDPTSKNRLTVDNVKGWLAQYIEMRAEDVARYPGEVSANHWDLIAADYDSSKEAHFIAAYFAGDRVTFMAGRGPIPEVRAFAQDEFPDNPNNVLDDLARRFTTGECWTTSADEVIAWAQG